MKRRITKCPACGGNDFEIVRLACRECNTAVEGSFEISRLAHLSAENISFVETFLRCRGNIKDVEREMGISYPTVRGRLDKIVALLGYDADTAKKRRRDILEALERNEMTATEAVKALEEGGK
ncbi:MAG: DUF2089 domain-containing protein [Spirochaetaceae bacterium]|nr:MAG: DUF2089 domain-containing protein [Spirochaetaceae bacterium]